MSQLSAKHPDNSPAFAHQVAIAKSITAAAESAKNANDFETLCSFHSWFSDHRMAWIDVRSSQGEMLLNICVLFQLFSIVVDKLGFVQTRRLKLRIGTLVAQNRLQRRYPRSYRVSWQMPSRAVRPPPTETTSGCWSIASEGCLGNRSA
jgi:hypothetical protein